MTYTKEGRLKKTRPLGRIIAILANQTGMAFVLMAISMLAVVSAAALAIDVGLLLTARAESQRAAESAALAGAGWLITAPNDETGARDRAKEYALRNTVRGDSVVLLDEDIDVILDSAKVRVRVSNLRERGTAIETFFARVFGVGNVNVRTLAAAWAAPTDEIPPTSVDCPLPLALLDEWQDADGDGSYDVGEYYDRASTGYDDSDIGKIVVAKVSGSGPTGPPQCRPENESSLVDIDACKDEPDSENWRCWYRESDPANGGGGGTSVLGPRIYPGDACGVGLTVGDDVYAASGSGNKQSLVNTTHADFGGSCTTTVVCDAEGLNCVEETTCQNGEGSFRDLIESDENIFWNDSPCNCPVRTNPTSADQCSTLCVEDSPRIRSVPLLDPSGVAGTGSGVTSTITAFTGVFVEMVSCNYDLGQYGGPEGNWNVYLRLMRAGTGVGGGGGGSGTSDPGGTTLKKLQLIE